MHAHGNTSGCVAVVNGVKACVRVTAERALSLRNRRIQRDCSDSAVRTCGCAWISQTAAASRPKTTALHSLHGRAWICIVAVSKGASLVFKRRVSLNFSQEKKQEAETAYVYCHFRSPSVLASSMTNCALCALYFLSLRSISVCFVRCVLSTANVNERTNA